MRTGHDKLVGDLLVVGGAVLYGVSNVGQEWMVCNHGSVEFLGVVGLFGSFINGLQLLVEHFITCKTKIFKLRRINCEIVICQQQNYQHGMDAIM